MAREGPGAPGRFSVWVRACLLAVLPLVCGCPRRPPPPVPADAGPAALGAPPVLADLDAAPREPLDAWVPERPTIVLTADFVMRWGDLWPRFQYEARGLPALSPDGKKVVVTGAESPRAQEPSLRIVTIHADDDHQTSVTVQSVREYRDAQYPPYVDEPTPGITDPLFRKLVSDIDRRLAAENAALFEYRPIPPCRVDRPGDAGVRTSASCVGLEVTYEHHHVRAVGRGGHVRLDRSVAAWKQAPSSLPPGYAGYAAMMKDELAGVYGSADVGILVFLFVAAVPRYSMSATGWHVVKLGP